MHRLRFVRSTPRPALLAPLAFLAVPAALAAQGGPPPTDTTVYRIEGIRVEAERPVTTVGGAAAIEVTLDSLTLPPLPTTEMILRELPMVHVRTNSRGQAEVTIRGSESRQVAVLVDGVPLTLAWDARTDVSVLPAAAVTELSVVRGLSSILHGPNVLGGVVEMSVARQPVFPRRSSLSATLGSDNLGGYAGAVVGQRPFTTEGGEGIVRAGVGYRDSRGFPLPDGVDEPVPVDDGLRLNTDVRNTNGFVAARYAANGGAWGSLSAITFDAERGIGAELGANEPRLWRYPEIARTIIAVSGGTGDRATPLGRGDLEASVGIDQGHTVIDAYATRAYDEVVSTEEGNDNTVTLRLLGDHTLGARGDLRTSFTYADIDHEAIVDGDAKDYEQHLMSLAGETVWRLMDGPTGPFEGLRLSLGAAWDRGTTPRTGGLESLGTLNDWGARVGLSAPMNGGSTLLHAGVSRRGRFPSLRETYSEALDRFIPNPNLHPEHLVSVEAGITTRLGKGEIQVVGFHNELSDAIRRITLEGGKRRRINSEKLRSTGLEILFSQTVGQLALGGDLLIQNVDLIDPGTSISTEPEDMPERMGSVHATLPLFAGIDATAEAEYTGSQFCQDANTGADVELDGATWFNAVLSRVWTLASGGGLGSHLETTISGVNLGDTALFDGCGLPRHGRLFRFEVRVF